MRRGSQIEAKRSVPFGQVRPVAFSCILIAAETVDHAAGEHANKFSVGTGGQRNGKLSNRRVRGPPRRDSRVSGIYVEDGKGV